MKDEIKTAVRDGFKAFPPEYWMRYIERIVPALRTAESNEQCIERIQYHTDQVQKIYHDRANEPP